MCAPFYVVVSPIGIYIKCNRVHIVGRIAWLRHCRDGLICKIACRYCRKVPAVRRCWLPCLLTIYRCRIPDGCVIGNVVRERRDTTGFATYADVEMPVQTPEVNDIERSTIEARPRRCSRCHLSKKVAPE